MERNRERRRFASSSMEEQSGHPRRSFPDEIEAEILLWLPVKTLIRFKSTCKTWYSLISSSQFQKDHFRRAQTKPPLLLTLKWELDDDNNRSVRFSTYSHNNKEGTLTLVNNFSKSIDPHRYMQSCNGLVCLSNNDPILICNPSTEELISLPSIHVPSYSVGFGFAASSQEFKVVSIFYTHGAPRCEIFTLGTSRWRKATCPLYPSYGIAPFLHKALHFTPHVPYYGSVEYTDRIAVFDIDTEKYRQAIPLPAFYYSLGDCENHYGILPERDFLRLSILGGSLCLAFDFGELSCRLELWLLKDYNKVEWVKAYDIDVSPVFPYRSYIFRAYLTDNMFDERIFLNCSALQGNKLLGYNIKDGVLTLKDKEQAATFYMETFYFLQSTQSFKDQRYR